MLKMTQRKYKSHENNLVRHGPPQLGCGEKAGFKHCPPFWLISTEMLGRRHNSQDRSGCIHLDTTSCLSAAGPRLSPHCPGVSPLAPAIPTNPSSAAFPSIFSFLCTCLWGQAQVGMWEMHFPSAALPDLGVTSWQEANTPLQPYTVSCWSHPAAASVLRGLDSTGWVQPRRRAEFLH